MTATPHSSATATPLRRHLGSRRCHPTRCSDSPARALTKIARQLQAAAPVLTGLARVLGVHTDERAWRVGVKGERWVGRELARLPDVWRSYHDLPIGPGAANLDHLVIGPGGVFSLNTKNLSGDVWLGDRALLVDGSKTDYLAKARREARRVGAALGRATGSFVAVSPVLVLLCDRITRNGSPADVAVLDGKELDRWLVRRPAVLGGSDVDRLASVAHNTATWER